MQVPPNSTEELPASGSTCGSSVEGFRGDLGLVLRALLVGIRV